VSTELTTPETPQPTVGRTIFRNTVWLTIGTIALKVLSVLFNIYVVRSLGDDRFGQYAIVASFPGLFVILIEFGMTQFVMREIARNRSQATLWFWDLAALRFLLAVAGALGIPLAAAATGYSAELALAIFLYCLTFLLSSFSAPLEAILTANDRFDYTTLLTVLGQISFMLLGAFVLWSGFGVLALVAVGLLGMLPSLVLSTWLVRRHRYLVGPIRLTPRRWPVLMKSGLPFGVISLALTVAFSIDTIILSKFHPFEVVGWYNAGYRLVGSLVGFLGTFSVAMVPTLSRAYVTDVSQVERWYFRSLRFILLITVPVAVGGMLVARPLILFLYTDEFLPAASVLAIIIWDVPLLMFTAFCGNMTTIVGEERAAARIYTINAVANLILNLIFIPQYGMIAAAVITVLTDLIGTFQFHYLLRHKMKLPGMLSTYWRVLAASLGLGVTVYVAGNQNLFVLIGLGAGAYGLLALALRLIGVDEWALVRRMLKFSSPDG
jgi:O-antigen/teichoic acid export membrane protein